MAGAEEEGGGDGATSRTTVEDTRVGVAEILPDAVVWFGATAVGPANSEEEGVADCAGVGVVSDVESGSVEVAGDNDDDVSAVDINNKRQWAGLQWE